jgi:hypothetical protein
MPELIFFVYKTLLLTKRSTFFETAMFLSELSIRQFMELINLQEYEYSKSYEYIEMAVYSVICFFVPFLLSHPQLFVGTVVNACLVLAALNLKGGKILPVILLPCAGVAAAGMIFGQLSMYLLYFVPFIWIANAVYVFSFKYFKLKNNWNYGLTLVIGTLMKSAILFASALVLYSLGIVPALFLTVMGPLQIATAILGGASAFFIQSGKKYVYRKIV